MRAVCLILVSFCLMPPALAQEAETEYVRGVTREQSVDFLTPELYLVRSATYGYHVRSFDGSFHRELHHPRLVPGSPVAFDAKTRTLYFMDGRMDRLLLAGSGYIDPTGIYTINIDTGSAERWGSFAPGNGPYWVERIIPVCGG